MPDPLLYGEAFALAGFVSAALTLLLSRVASRSPGGRPEQPGPRRVGPFALLFGVSAGFAAGCWLLRLPTTWTPASALDRYLTFVFPLAVGVELLATRCRDSIRVAWLLRGGLALAAGRILLHGSVYLQGPHREWTSGETAALLMGSAVALVSVWWLLLALGRRAGEATVTLSLSMTLLGSGLAIMLEGYLRGGTAPLPLAAAILGGTFVAARASRPTAPPAVAIGDPLPVPAHGVAATPAALDGVLGLGVVGLASTLFLSHFFAGLSTGSAVALLSAPLWGWLAEYLPLRWRHGAGGLAMRLLLVAFPIAAVLLLAMREFVKETLPLLTIASL